MEVKLNNIQAPTDNGIEVTPTVEQLTNSLLEKERTTASQWLPGSVPEFDTPAVEQAPAMQTAYAPSFTSEGEQLKEKMLDDQNTKARQIRDVSADDSTLSGGFSKFGADENLAKTPIEGTLTGKTFNNTLYASRLADMLNSKMYFRHGDIGNAQTGQGSAGADMYQMAPVATEEMRSMDRARQIQGQGELQDQQRKGRVRDIATELTARIGRDTMDLLRQEGITDDTIRAAAANAQRRVMYEMPAARNDAELMRKFVEEFLLGMRSKVFTRIAEAFKNNEAIATWAAQYFMGNSSYSNELGMRYELDRIARENTNSPEQYNAAKQILNSLMAGDNIAAMFNMFNAGLSGHPGTSNIGNVETK